MPEAKPYDISKQVVWEAYLKVKANHGAAGVDGESIAAFGTDLKGNLYKIWNRMSSGSYFPPPVRLLEIPKASGGSKAVGNSHGVGDRVGADGRQDASGAAGGAVFSIPILLYSTWEIALDAVDHGGAGAGGPIHVIDLDIKGFFDNLDHELVARRSAITRRPRGSCGKIERRLRAPVQRQDGSREERTKGSPQGSVVSPLLANLFMHYAFDLWMTRTYPDIRFERYADDVIIHAKSQAQAEQVLEAVRERLKERLELHPGDTKIVYCQDDDRRGQRLSTSSSTLGYTPFAPAGQESMGEVLRELPAGDRRTRSPRHPGRRSETGGRPPPGTTNLWRRSRGL